MITANCATVPDSQLGPLVLVGVLGAVVSDPRPPNGDSALRASSAPLILDSGLEAVAIYAAVKVTLAFAGAGATLVEKLARLLLAESSKAWEMCCTVTGVPAGSQSLQHASCG